MGARDGVNVITARGRRAPPPFPHKITHTAIAAAWDDVPYECAVALLLAGALMVNTGCVWVLAGVFLRVAAVLGATCPALQAVHVFIDVDDLAAPLYPRTLDAGNILRAVRNPAIPPAFWSVVAWVLARAGCPAWGRALLRRRVVTAYACGSYSGAHVGDEPLWQVLARNAPCNTTCLTRESARENHGAAIVLEKMAANAALAHGDMSMWLHALRALGLRGLLPQHILVQCSGDGAVQRSQQGSGGASGFPALIERWVRFGMRAEVWAWPARTTDTLLHLAQGPHVTFVGLVETSVMRGSAKCEAPDVSAKRGTPDRAPAYRAPAKRGAPDRAPAKLSWSSGSQATKTHTPMMSVAKHAPATGSTWRARVCGAPAYTVRGYAKLGDAPPPRFGARTSSHHKLQRAAGRTRVFRRVAATSPTLPVPPTRASWRVTVPKNMVKDELTACHSPCRYGVRCTLRKCGFLHPAGWVRPSLQATDVTRRWRGKRILPTQITALKAYDGGSC